MSLKTYRFNRQLLLIFHSQQHRGNEVAHTELFHISKSESLLQTDIGMRNIQGLNIKCINGLEDLLYPPPTSTADK